MRLLFVLLLAGCHPCGENVGERYARFLDVNADCHSIRQNVNSDMDMAMCSVGSEDWLCGEGWCNVIGPRVLVRRVQ